MLEAALKLQTIMRQKLGRSEPYLMATAFVMLAFGFKLLTPHSILSEIPFLMFFTATTAAGLYGGLYVGLFATLLSALISDYCFLPPLGTLIKNNWHQDFKVLLYVLDCAGMSYLCEALRSALAKAKRLEASEAMSRLRLQESEEHLQTAFDSLQMEQFKLESIFGHSPAALAIWRGEKLICEKANARYEERLHGASPLGRGINEVFPDFIENGLVERIKAVFTSSLPFSVVELKTRLAVDGIFEERFFDVRFAVMQDDQQNNYGVFEHAFDVTDRVMNRIKLERSRQEAEAANTAKSAFLANMSHEIRTPLSAILGYANLLKDPELTATESRQFIETIQRQSVGLTRIIDDILDIAKVESGKLEVESVQFSFQDLIDDIFKIFVERTRAKGIYLRADVSPEMPPVIKADPTRIRQILINLIGNAVKFTESGGVTVRVLKPLRDGKSLHVNFLVRDTGIGMSAQQIASLFQPFVQADNSMTRRFGGSGLGLALSKRLAVAMGGTIYVFESTPGEGSAFSFTIPVEIGSEVAVAARGRIVSDHSGRLQGLHVLLADDSPDNQFLARRILTKEGAHVASASDGNEAVLLGLASPFDVILMDIQMPGRNGYEATQALREAGVRCPIIALTAHAMAEERALTLAAGCNDHVTKPIDKSELINSILKSLT